MSKTETFLLSSRGCKTALLVEQRASDDVIQLVLRDPNGNEVAQVVLKWQAGAVWLDGWSHENIAARDETPDVETTLYWEDQGKPA